MDPEAMEFAKGVVAFLLPAGTALIAISMWLRARGPGRAEQDRRLEALREENAQLRAEVELRMAELDERVDFVERRLVRQGEPSRLPAPPEVATPV
jgi:uncharacterized membrane protein